MILDELAFKALDLIDRVGFRELVAVAVLVFICAVQLAFGYSCFRQGRRAQDAAWRLAWERTRLEADNLKPRPDPQPAREIGCAVLDVLLERVKRGNKSPADKAPL